MKGIKYFKVVSPHIVAALSYAVTPSHFVKYDESLVNSIMKEHPNATLEFYDSEYKKINEQVEDDKGIISEEDKNIESENRAEVIEDEQFEHKKFGNSKWKK